MLTVTIIKTNILEGSKDEPRVHHIDLDILTFLDWLKLVFPRIYFSFVDDCWIVDDEEVRSYIMLEDDRVDKTADKILALGKKLARPC